MKTGYVNFPRQAPQIGYPSHTLSEPLQLESFVMKPNYPSIFFESLAKTKSGILVETTKTCVFLHVHPLPANSRQYLNDLLN